MAKCTVRLWEGRDLAILIVQDNKTSRAVVLHRLAVDRCVKAAQKAVDEKFDENSTKGSWQILNGGSGMVVLAILKRFLRNTVVFPHLSCFLRIMH